MSNTLRGKVNRSSDRISLIFILYALFTIAIYSLPMLKITLPYVAVAPVLLASIFFLMYTSAKWMYYSVVLCVASILIAAINIMTGAYPLVDAINEMIRNIRFFLPALWGCYALKYCNEKHRKFVMIFFGLMCGYILVKTFNALEQVPDVCRELAKSTSQDTSTRTNFRMENVGGFEFSYMMGIVTLGLIWTALKTSNKLTRVICIVASVVCYYFIIQTMYTLLLILTFVGTILIFFFATKSKILRVVLIAGAVAMFVFMEPLFKVLADFFSFNYGLEEKFTNMYLALKYDDVDMVGSRPEYLLRAFVNWTENPILGARNIDNKAHSFVMSYLVNSGVVGLSVWVGFFAYNWRMLRSQLSSKSLFDTVMIYTALLAFFNPIGYVFEVMFAAYFVIPIWTTLVNVKSNNKKLEA